MVTAKPLSAILLIIGAAAHSQEVESQQPLPTPAELESQGAVIGEIFIEPQNIFNVAEPKENKALFRTANRLHIKTQERVIRQQLLFRSGDKYSQSTIDESERILRSARYLYDAYIRAVAYRDGRVDIAVTTRDVWTLNPGLSFGRKGGQSTSGFEIEELNVLGTGTSISASHRSGVDRGSNAIEYKDAHVAGSWVALDANYSSNTDGSARALSVERPFYSLNTPWAFGTKGMDDDRIEALYDRGQAIDQFRDRERSMTVYGGWSRGLIDGWTRRWTVGATYEQERFGTAPDWTGIALLPADRKLVYPWIGFDLSEDEFVKERNHDQIGRTEDFQLGARFSARVGWASNSFGSDRDALMFKASLGRGFDFGDRSTLLLDTRLSGRFERGSLSNTVLEGAIRYYFEQSRRSLFFATLEGATGRNLDLDTQILLGGDNGLRGYPLRYQSGASRALLTVEQRYFTEWYPFRLFRIGAAAFFDVGRTWGSSPLASPSLGLLKDAGIGLRIGNARSGLGNVIHIDLAFPLDGDASIDKVQFIVETKRRF